MWTDRVHRVARTWSNRELRKVAHLFRGDVVNVSAWRDLDKEGARYRDYFVNAASYAITNWKTEARGFQGAEGEIFLDLEEPLPQALAQRFDVVFNHTTLEHVFEFRLAFANLCRMSRDVVIVCVPFLQPIHADYGDYWRFSPLAVKRLFEENGFGLLYLSFNDHPRSSVYVFAVASREPARWAANFPDPAAWVDVAGGRGPESDGIGARAIPNRAYRASERLRSLWGRLRHGRAK